MLTVYHRRACSHSFVLTARKIEAASDYRASTGVLLSGLRYPDRKEVATDLTWGLAPLIFSRERQRGEAATSNSDTRSTLASSVVADSRFSPIQEKEEKDDKEHKIVHHPWHEKREHNNAFFLRARD